MTDIVERIHSRVDKGWRRVTFAGAELDEILQAFAEIERLRRSPPTVQENEELRRENARLRAEVEQLRSLIGDLNAERVGLRMALQGMVDEWDKLTRYGSPLAKVANERVSFARSLLKSTLAKECKP
jgi:predicted nuclease with TOPRIM domain